MTWSQAEETGARVPGRGSYLKTNTGDRGAFFRTGWHLWWCLRSMRPRQPGVCCRTCPRSGSRRTEREVEAAANHAGRRLRRYGGGEGRRGHTTEASFLLPLVEVVTTREGSDVVLLSERETSPADGLETHGPRLWWRRWRVECSQFANTGRAPGRQTLKEFERLTTNRVHDCTLGSPGALSLA